MTPSEFIQRLLGAAEGGVVTFRAVPPNKSYKTQLGGDFKMPTLTKSSNWWFSVCPSDSANEKARLGPVVWCDIDGVVNLDSVLAKAAPPSALVRTGHGVHVYYILEEADSAEFAQKLAKLAVLALNGDKKCTDVTRLMRVPGTVNVKREPHVECKLDERASPMTKYKPERVEEMLVTALLSGHWMDGLRNTATLGFASVVARAEWPQTRAERVIKGVCKATGDDEVTSRLLAIKLTYAKHENGEPTSTQGLAEVLGAKFKPLIGLLGYDAQDGEVKLGDEVIGQATTVLQDLVQYVLREDNRIWGYAEGQLFKWGGDVWKPAEPKVLTSSVFQMMDKLVVIKGATEKRRPAKPSEAKGVSDMIQGSLAASPMDEHDPHIIGLANGTFNLETGEFRPSTKEDRLRRLLPVEYHPEAEAPSWHKFLEEAAPDAKEYLQEYVGYCLKPGNFFQKMLWAYGPSNTGKSTFLVTVFNLFGPTAVMLSSQNISQYQTATLADAYIAMCTELTQQKFRTAIFKSLVSGDPVLARHPYGRPFAVEFKGKIIWGSNSLPSLDEVEGMWRRLVIIPFTNLPKKLDVTLLSRLKTQELSGIFNWAYEGLRRVVEYEKTRSWAVPDASVEAVAHYRRYADILDIFMSQELERGDRYSVSFNEVFARFQDFSRSIGHQQIEFGAWFVEEFVRRGYDIQDRMTLTGARIKGANHLAWGMKGL